MGILNSPVKAWHCAAAELPGRLIINPDNEPFLLSFFPQIHKRLINLIRLPAIDAQKYALQFGLHMKHSYARSLANFAADLGPFAWKVAARKISNVLPPGHEFGPGWVSDDDVSQRQHSAVRDERN
ncbi:hypothetical protein KIW84_073572 [Lathyrus oleraceus]|uniref:Uncharacterized protein n=1 Tax=Pisum sativum TaxID=3888 RepID=A0A9D4VRN3_PEA|nr:hypothetical protein KIW84_073572 [Pisum sativum]